MTDTELSGLSHTEQVRQLIAGGAQVIQLREKRQGARAFFDDAAAALTLARAAGVKIIVNDRVDVALALCADGVHLGQDDLPPVKARSILGPDAIIGFSTHTIAQALTASSLPIDYIAFGPIFPTTSKPDPETCVGVDLLISARRVVRELPLVAIGGINVQSLCSVFKAGADSAALISAVVSGGGDIASRLRQIAQQARDC